MRDENLPKTEPMGSVKTQHIRFPTEKGKVGIEDDGRRTFEIAQAELRQLDPPIELKSFIATGGFGIVAEAITRGIVYGQPDLEAKCAIKIPLIGLVRSPNQKANEIYRQLLYDEAIHSQQAYLQLLAQGNGFERNLVRCYRLGGYDKGEKTIPHIVFEYVEGLNLHHNRRLSFDHVARIGAITCEVLGAVHSLGILHMDIKPNNILIPKGRIRRLKIADFGLSRGLYTPASGEVLMAVSYGFAAPEQIIENGKVDVFSDIYSLGATLYFMLTRNLVYKEADGHALNETGLEFPQHKRIEDVRPDTPPGLIRIIEMAIKHNPAERYPNVNKMKDDLLNEFPRLKRTYDLSGHY